MIAQEIKQAFGYVGYKDFVNDQYSLEINSGRVYVELTVYVPDSRLGHSEIHFYRKTSFWNSRPETYSGIAREFDNYVLLIANGHVYIIKQGQVIVDEKNL